MNTTCCEAFKYPQELLIYKINICTSNIHNNTISCSFLHVSAEFHHLQEVYKPIFKTHQYIIHYDSNTHYIILISATEFKNIRACKMLLKFYTLVYHCTFHYCRQTTNCIQRNSFLNYVHSKCLYDFSDNRESQTCELTSNPSGDIFRYSLTSLVFSITLIPDISTHLYENMRPSTRTEKIQKKIIPCYNNNIIL
jgi:hypothetical protein